MSEMKLFPARCAVWCVFLGLLVCFCVTDWSSQRWIPLPQLISDGEERGSGLSEPVNLVVLGNDYEQEEEWPEAWSHVR